MENKKNKSECQSGKCNKGVHCDVKNCLYHEGQNQCMATCISVGPSSATSSMGTNCATFKPKENC